MASAAAHVVLGVAGEMVGAGGADAATTKVGGAAVWLGDAPPPAADTQCRLCGAPLSLVLQAYAPLSPPVCAEAVERTLYMLACLAPTCLNRPGAWRALRLQLPPAAPPAAAVAAPPPPRQPEDDWGCDAAADWGDSAETPAPDAPSLDLDLSDLAAELDAALATSAAVAAATAQGRRRRNGAAEEPGTESAATAATPPPSALPEFYVVAAEEAETDQAPADAAAARAAALLTEYNQRSGDGASAAAGAPPDDASDVGGSGGGGGGEEESWGGEQYERVTVRGLSRHTYKFLKRLQRAPQQCVRYGLGADPLYPTPERPAPPPCERCGGPRTFELQLMPPLLHFIDEAFDMERPAASRGPAGAARAQLRAAARGLDWTTVLLFSCARACVGSAGAGGAADVREEWVWVNSAEGDLSQLERAADEAAAADASGAEPEPGSAAVA